jgi:hypothetical protein
MTVYEWFSYRQLKLAASMPLPREPLTIGNSSEKRGYRQRQPQQGAEVKLRAAHADQPFRRNRELAPTARQHAPMTAKTCSTPTGGTAMNRARAQIAPTTATATKTEAMLN